MGGAAGGAVAGGLNAAVYGGDVGQGILRGAGFGALGGAIFGGIDIGISNITTQPGFRWELVRVGLMGAAGGGIAKLSGGEFWEGVAFSSAIAGSRFLYRVITAANGGTPREPSYETSDGSFGAKNKDQSLHSFNSKKSNMGNKFGTYGLPRNKIETTLTGEEAAVLRFVSDKVPLFESISQFHDALLGDVVKVHSNQTVTNILNYPTMPIAAGITAVGALHEPTLGGTFALYDKDNY